MKKYIFYSDKLLKRAGGPSTYLYNLKNGLKNSKEKNLITFIYDTSEENNETNKNKLRENVKSIIYKFPWLYEKIVIRKRIKRNSVFNKVSNINKNDIIMFHSTEDFSKAYDLLPKTCTKILMSHSPEVASKEITNVLKTKCQNYDFRNAERYFLDNYDLFSFNNADIIVFPSKESMEPYYQTCSKFSEVIKNKKVYYLETGTEELKFNYTKEEYRKKLGIPEDAFVLCFIGRHNWVKGYDNFVKIASKMIKKHNDIYVITAGVGDIESPKNKRWIDVGWTNDPGSIANASDVFILPNKRTYFDLVLLEMLSLGKTCIASNTGGNITVSKHTEGVILYDDVSQAVEKIDFLYNNKNKIYEYGNENRKLYEKRYTIEKFTERYIEFFNKISKEKGK